MSIISADHGDARLSIEFWQKTTLLPSGCWEWSGRVSSMRTAMHGAKVAWKFAYERLVGAVMKGSTTKRLCDTPLCVNPAHRLVTSPLACPTCGHALPRQQGEAKVFTTADGGVAIDPDDREEKEPQKYTMAELAADLYKGRKPEPEDDPNDVPYRPGDAKLTRRYKDVKRGRKEVQVFETTDGDWVTEKHMTEAQMSHMLRELDGDGYWTDDRWQDVG